MVVHQGYDNLSLNKPVVTLGTFDGVHLGHRQLINAVVKAAHVQNGDSVIITFYPHPRQVVGNENHDFFFLSTPEEKLAMLEETGIGHVIIQEFNKEFAKIKACDFISEVLVERTGTRNLIMGYDHRFGKAGEGDINSIRRCAELSELKVDQVNALIMDGKPVSSSLIRESLISGRLDEANKMLGYTYSISGSVIAGKRIGRSIGFPTANIKPGDECKLIPGNGVYAVEVLLEDRTFKGMLSIGTNPTVSPLNITRSIEVHIIDFERDIYDKPITVRFRKRMRDEKRFSNTGELMRQMENDKLNALTYLT